MDPNDRRRTQQGRFQGKVGRKYMSFDVRSQGVPTGERVVIRLLYEDTLGLDLTNLGMLPDMREAFEKHLRPPGLVIVSAPFGEGLSSSWQAVLNAADRYVTDWVAVLDHDDRDTERVNIDVQRFDSRKGETPATHLKRLFLRQPDVVVVPNPVDIRTMDMLTDSIQKDQRMVITQTRAGSASEALLRVMSLAGKRDAFIESVTAVTCQRLLRRLCDRCKTAVPANPKAVAQMGGNPRETTVLYKPYQLPPPEQRVDENGKPVEMEPCPDCSGIGYLGRTAIYELVVIDDEIRKVLAGKPHLETVARAVRERGNLTLMEQACKAVLDGRTSLAEVQRVMTPKPAAAPAKGQPARK
jgi:type II secretory ATPase GspE/PulE/Tfp pilus assembly ATPase PilB-like protein